MAVKIVKGNTYSCPALKPPKGNEKHESKSKTEYSFDISKGGQIFEYYLLKDRQIRLLDDHKIPPPKELKGKMYCKCHNSYNHATFNCIVLHRAIQRLIKEGRFWLADKGAIEMIVDTKTRKGRRNMYGYQNERVPQEGFY